MKSARLTFNGFSGGFGPGRSRKRPYLGIAPVIAAALSLGSGIPSHAGQSSSSFLVSVTLAPPACSVSSGFGSLSVSCEGGNPVIGVVLERPGSSPVVAVPGSDPQVGYRSPDPKPSDGGWDSDRLLSFVVDRSARVQSPTAVGEYSSRVVWLNDREYLEMTVTW
ncbi:hypothetical protein GCM10027034_33730 [Ramlibacter solisilvae]|uniref:hypothetical protein n=1 Tax=Ramlibacter tataouinensis TaxID=94132 RepID=UPI0011AE8B30|nr:hypothetical protein [Ramlibacter tataouinensis]